MKKIFIISLLASTVLYSVSCYKDPKDRAYLAERSYLNATNALLKINYLSLYPTNPLVQISIDNQRVSGLIGGRTPFPGGGYNTNGSSFPDYLSVKPGGVVLTIALPKKGTNVDSVLFFSGNVTTTVGKNYTAHVTDTGSKTKMLLVEDDLTAPPANSSKYRFLNMMPNVAAIDLYYGTTLMATNIPFLGSSPYFNMEVPLVSTAWTIRETGTSPTSTALATYSSTNTTVNQRVYTAFALGYKGSSATATKPYISFLLNK
jgi:hypothetical protein